jgi:hypothetical protein
VVRLNQNGTSTTIWPVVSIPDDAWWWWWWLRSSRWNKNWQGKQTYSKKTYLTTARSTTNPIRPDLDSNPDLRIAKPATNRLSYSTAFLHVLCSPVRMSCHLRPLSVTPFNFLQSVMRTCRKPERVTLKAILALLHLSSRNYVW